MWRISRREREESRSQIARISRAKRSAGCHHHGERDSRTDGHTATLALLATCHQDPTITARRDTRTSEHVARWRFRRHVLDIPPSPPAVTPSARNLGATRARVSRHARVSRS